MSTSSQMKEAANTKTIMASVIKLRAPRLSRFVNSPTHALAITMRTRRSIFGTRLSLGFMDRHNLEPFPQPDDCRVSLLLRRTAIGITVADGCFIADGRLGRLRLRLHAQFILDVLDDATSARDLADQPVGLYAALRH
jgi:hypothetical protein